MKEQNRRFLLTTMDGRIGPQINPTILEEVLKSEQLTPVEWVIFNFLTEECIVRSFEEIQGEINKSNRGLYRLGNLDRSGRNNLYMHTTSINTKLEREWPIRLFSVYGEGFVAYPDLKENEHIPHFMRLQTIWESAVDEEIKYELLKLTDLERVRGKGQYLVKGMAVDRWKLLKHLIAYGANAQAPKEEVFKAIYEDEIRSNADRAKVQDKQNMVNRDFRSLGVNLRVRSAEELLVLEKTIEGRK